MEQQLLNELKLVHQSESAQTTDYREQFVKKVQQAAKYVPIEAIRMVQTDVIAIQAEAIHQTSKQKSTSKNVGDIQVQGVELVENPTNCTRTTSTIFG